MADRFLFKKFASETNDVGQFGSFQSTGGNIGDGVKTTDPDLIQSLPAWKAGWGNAVDNGLLLPRLEEMNGVQRVFAEMLWNQWRDGITFWQAGAPVKALQSIVMYQTGDEKPKLYINKTGVNGTNPPPQDTDNWEPLNDSVGCGEIGDIGFAPLGIDESLNLRRYLNGQVISQSQFVSFTNKVKSAIALYPNLATTEANWQAEKTNSKLGQCGKFVIDDTAGTIRLPCVVNAQGLVDLALIGGIKSESLPDATYYSDSAWDTSSGDASRSLVASKGGYEVNNTGKGLLAATKQDTTPSYSYTYGTLSSSNSTYQDNAPVQQEAIQYPYYIQVATGVEETLPAIREYKINTPFFFGQSMYSDVAPDNASWLASNGQYNARSVYPYYYDWLVEQMNAGVSGFVASTSAYTDYDFVINTADQTFRLPLIAERVIVAKKEATDGDYTWYNLYSDGWLEQGGYIYQAGDVTGVANTTTLPKAFKNNDYAITMFAGVGNSGWQYTNGVGLGTGGVGANERETHMTPTTFTWFNATGVSGAPIFWEAKGYAEVPTQSDYTEVSGLYYYVGDTVQDASLINAGAVLGQLSDKISRTAASDREMVVGWGMPDYTAGITINATSYTAPKEGIVLINCQHADHATNQVTINGVQLYSVSMTGSYAAGTLPPFEIPVSAGDVITSNQNILKFYPYKGA